MFKKNVKKVLAVVMAASIIMQQGTVVQATEGAPEDIVSSGDDTTLVSEVITQEPEESGDENESEEPEDSEESGDSEVPGDSSETGASTETEASTEETTDEVNSDEEVPEEEGDEENLTDEEVEEEELSEDETDAEKSAEEETTEEEKELPEGVNGMPEGYELSDTQKELKSDALSHAALESFEDLTEGEDYVADQVIALADSEEEAKAIAEAYSGELDSFSYGVAVINLSESELSVSDAFSYGLSDSYDLPYVEPNFTTTIDEPVEQSDMLGTSMLFSAGGTVPSGNGFTDRWWTDNIQDEYLNPESDYYQWHHDMINTYSAWGVTTGNPQITVAVIDTGLNGSNVDFASATRGGSGNISYKNFSKVTSEGDADKVGHGTHVSGIIAGRINDKLGAGVAPGVNVLSLKVSNGSGINAELPNDAIISAINYVASGNNGNRTADIANLSIGSPMYSAAYKQAIDRAYGAGVTVVVAMGNDYGSNTINYPAAFDHVIAVSAVDRSGSLANYSTYGAWADISAPGSDIYSASSTNNNTYTLMSGTSMAAPIVSGACALYMSAVGHVDPDTMERVIKSSVTGSAGAGTGAGILDLSKLFNGDVTAPRISLSATDASGKTSETSLIAEAQDGATATAATDVGKDAVLTFTPLNFGGSDEGNKNTRIVYTTDGKAPSVFNGEVLSGTAVDSGATISVSEFAKDITGKTKFTVKAAAVTGMGVMSKVTTIVFTVDPDMSTKSNELTDHLDIKITNAPNAIVAGKSFKLEALVTSDDATQTVSQKVTWRIESYSGGDLSKCKINASNGTITTVAGKTGSLVVSCATPDGRARDSQTIKVTNAFPVSTMVLSATATGLGFKYGNNSSTGETATVSLSTLTDTAKNNLLTSSIYSVKDMPLQWTSSNPNVVAITDKETQKAGLTEVNIKARSVGSATITCKALDGSGKSAKITIKVTADNTKKVTGITLYDGRAYKETSEPAAPKSLFATADPFTINAKQLSADGGVNYINPIWSTSNAKVAQIQVDSTNGNIVTVTPIAKGSANITCAAADGSGKKATLKVTVLQPVTSVTVSGQKYIAEGTSAKYTAAVLPASANNKNVTWSLEGDAEKLAAEGITINAKNGTVSVAKGVTHAGVITVRADAVDGSKCYGTYKFEVHEKATKVTAAVDPKFSNTIATSAKGSYLTTTRIVASALDKEGNDLGTQLSFKTSNAKVATVQIDSNNPNAVIVTAVGKGTATITATAQDGSKKFASVKITVVQLVEKIVITGQPAVVVGNKATFKATVYPANADNKKIKWALVNMNGGPGYDVRVTINQNGVVTTTANATGTWKVIATPMDTGEELDDKDCQWATFKTVAYKANHVTITAPHVWRTDSINDPVEKKDPITKQTVIASCRIYDTDIADPEDTDNKRHENEILFNWEVMNGNKTSLRYLDSGFVQWSSSNTKVAQVEVEKRQLDGEERTVAVVKGLKPGTANITCTVRDGSNAKATVKVTVITPASDIEIVAGNNLLNSGVKGADYEIAEGVSTTIKAPIGSAYGKPSVSKVEWSYEIGFINNGNFIAIGDWRGTSLKDAERLEAFFNKNKYFFTFSNGKLTVQSPAAIDKAFDNIKKNFNDLDLSDDPLAVRVIAKTTDGTGYSDSKVFMAIEPTTWLSTSYKDRAEDEYVSYSSYLIPADYIDSEVVAIKIDSNFDSGRGDELKQVYSISSSNPNVATGNAKYTKMKYIGWDSKTNRETYIPDDGYKNFFLIYPHGKGTTQFTITALDGTNKKVTITVKVQ